MKISFNELHVAVTSLQDKLRQKWIDYQ